MKVVIDARLYGLENGGIGRYIVNLIEELQKIDKKNSYLIILRKQYYKKLKLNKNFKKKEFDYRHYSMAEQLKLPKVLKDLSPDIVHFPHFNVPIRYRSKFVVTIHDLLMHRQKGVEATTLSPFKYIIKRFGYRKVIDSAIINSKYIITPSKHVKADIAQKYASTKDKIKPIYEGIGPKFKKTTDKKAGKILQKHKIKTPYFVYTGSAYPHKNLKRAVEAIVQLNNIQDCGLVVITSKNIFRQRLQKIISELDANKHVKLLGFVSDDELSAIYQKSVGFLYPSLEEGFGLPGLEAIQAGTTALVSDIPVFKEIYGESAYYFNPFNFESISKAMVDVLQMKPAKRKSYIKKAQESIKKYSWEKMALETLKIYEKAASK